VKLFQQVLLPPYLFEAGLPHEGASAWPIAEILDEGVYRLKNARGEGHRPEFSGRFFVVRHALHSNWAAQPPYKSVFQVYSVIGNGVSSTGTSYVTSYYGDRMQIVYTEAS
jgi:hypothetical protein